MSHLSLKLTLSSNLLVSRVHSMKRQTPKNGQGARNRNAVALASVVLGSDSNVAPYDKANRQRHDILPALVKKPYPIVGKKKTIPSSGYQECKGRGQKNPTISQVDIEHMGKLITDTERLIKAGEYRDAAKQLLGDRIIPAGHPQKFLLLLDCFFGMEDMRRALDTARQFVKAHPQLEVSHCSLAVCLSTIGRAKEALERCNEGISLIPTSSKLHVLRGKLYKQAGLLKEALKDFDTARSLGLAAHIQGSVGPSFILASP